MPKSDIKNKINHNSKKDLRCRFFFAEKISDLAKIKPEIELCIIKTDFSKNEIKAIKKFKKANPNMEVWIESNNPSRENIIMANETGIQTVISSTANQSMVEDFFKQKEKSYMEKIITTQKQPSDINGVRLMIVDDNSMNIELLEEVLSGLELDITSFTKPKEAYAKIQKEKYGLFLLDIMMPEMSGFELAKLIKDTPQNTNAGIIFISALSDPHTKIRGYDLGSIAYIEKPFDVNIVKSQIHNILKNKKDLEENSMDKENFLATVAHDLKTPMRAGINALNLLLNDNFGELIGDQQEIVEDILYSTKFMRDMVENVLCKNKIENNQMSLSKQVYDISELVQNCIELTKYILAPKKQKIKFECNIKNKLVPFDFLEMKRAIHNLIANASQYSPEGGKILISINGFGETIGISVQDFGQGIDLENQNDVFLQYISFAKKYKTVGSGLGLYITKKIVEAHGGEIVLDSKVGIGTKITILLPLYNKM